MSIKKEEVLDAISAMSIMDIVQLIDMIEKKFGISTRSLLSDSVTAKTPESLESDSVEQTEFKVILSAIGNNKIPVIKTVRSVTGLGLKEAKELVESAPVTLKESVSKFDAEDLRKKLESVGASVEVK